MTHKDAPPITDEQRAFEDAYRNANEKRGIIVGLSRDRKGNYHAAAAQDAWELWRAAQKRIAPNIGCPICKGHSQPGTCACWM